MPTEEQLEGETAVGTDNLKLQLSATKME